MKKIYDILNVNILLNGVRNKITSYDYVISNKINENLSLSFNKNNYGDNKFKVTNKNKNKYKIIKLDHFIKKFELKNLLIKIDVQGFESKVILSAKKFILKKVPLLIEFDCNFLKNKDSKKIIKLMTKNYKFFIILIIKIQKKMILKILKKFLIIQKKYIIF